MRPSAILLALLLVLPAGLHGQMGAAGPRRTADLGIGSFVGIGSGPTRSGVWGVEAEYSLNRWLVLRAEYSRWASGLAGACIHRWPESYSCTVRGQALLAGVGARVPEVGRVTPYVEAAAGRFGRDRSGWHDRPSAAIALGAGAKLRIHGGWSAELGGRFLQPFDPDYETLMNEPLRYTVGVLGIEYRLAR